MLELGYILLSVLMLFVLVYGYYRLQRDFLPQKRIQKNIFYISFTILVWLIYTYLLSLTGVLVDEGFPPKFPLLIFFPFFIFCILFYRKNRENTSIQYLPIKAVVLFQSFRVLVEILLVFTYYKGFIPIEASYEGLNFDIFMGLSAIVVGLFFYQKKQLLYVWNIVGILMIVFVGFIIATSIFFPSIWGYTDSPVSPEFIAYPYLLIPVFLAPLGIFMHVIGLIQLRQFKKKII